MIKKIVLCIAGVFGALQAECLVKKDSMSAQTCVGRVHLAAFHGHTSCLKKLLKSAPDSVNAQDSEWLNTPTHYCVKDLASDAGKQACLKLLLKKGANLAIRNSMGCTALDLAAQFSVKEAFISIRDGKKLRSNSCEF